MRIVNECRLDFSYKLSPEGAIVRKTIFSNTVSTEIIKDLLKIHKYVDKKKLILLTY